MEFAGIGPAPSLLSDMGAEVLRIDRPIWGYWSGVPGQAGHGPETSDGREAVLELIARSHGPLIEGFRPGVMERLGLGQVCLARIPGSSTGGWGGDRTALWRRPPATISTILPWGSCTGSEDGPVLPNLVGDFGGGGVYLALGLVAGMLEARHRAKGR